MAHLTNKLNLPEPIVAAVRRDDYDPGDSDITVTQLIAPPKLVELSRRHDEEIEEDASDRLWALMGKVAHSILERGTAGHGLAGRGEAGRGEAGQGEEVMVEERLFADVLGWKVSGQFDRMVLTPVNGKGWRLIDFKLSSVWEAVHGLKEERVQQLNLLAELARRNGYPIAGLQVVMIFRDWLKPKAARDESYPQRQVETFEVELWEPGMAAAFLAHRLDQHQKARELADEEIPVCTPEERWQKPTTWAVKKEGRKTAVRVFDTRQDAEEYLAVDDHSKLWVEERPGEPTRCLHYCPVARFCEFGRWFHEEEEEEG